MIGLSRAMLDRLPRSLRRPPRGEVGIGIVHIGPGAFHRAHQASYVDTLLDRDPRWGIAAVSLRSRATVDALAGQDGLYAIAIRGGDPALRLVDAHRVFLGPEEATQTRELLASPAVQLVTATVTEKGYCLAADGTLDLAHPDIAADLRGPAGTAPRSLVGWLVDGLARRRASGTAPFTAMPCDNLPANGRKLQAALVAFARQRDGGLADWIAGEVRVPSTMVDSITPASDDALYAEVAQALGAEDGAAVQREPFLQWIIEDIGQQGPDLASAGATLTGNVAGWERAKLRILNAAHSTLAYAGLLRGAGTVAEAMADPWLAGFVATMVAHDIAPVLPATAGLDLGDYAAAVFQRFRNPAIAHRLEQIAQDGSQKLPFRLGDSLIASRAARRWPAHLFASIGCWIAFVSERSQSGRAIADPAAAALTAAAADSTAEEVAVRLAEQALGVPASLRDDREALAAIGQAAAAARRRDWARLLPMQPQR